MELGSTLKVKIVVRFAPSPTGWLHLGGARTALFNYLFAKKHGGKIILRIEDTDKERSKPEYEKDIIDNLAWLSIKFDETIRQSDRSEIHKKYLKKLIESGSAFVSKETPVEAGDREEVIRFRNPNKRVEFEDLIKGRISFDTAELGDFVIAKSIDEPLFHLAVVVDDFLMGVTDVIRGEDHISNTPRQILIQEAIGAPRPRYAHIPLILAPDRSKLSKRKHGESVSIKYYREREYESEALVNYLSLLGWNPGTNQEFFSIDELLEQFALERIQKGGAVFNIEKLNWLNKEHLRKHPPRALIDRIFPKTVIKEKSDKQINTLWLTVFNHFCTAGEMKKSLERGGEFDYLKTETELQYEPSELIWKDNSDANTSRLHLKEVRRIVEALPEKSFVEGSLKKAVWPYAEERGRGAVLWPMRFALSGRNKSPNPFTLASILGKDETLKRLAAALKKIS